MQQPPIQPPRQYPPTRVADMRPEPKPTRLEQQPPAPAPLSKLADTPGPLPFGPGATASSPKPTGEEKVWNPASGRFRRVRQLGRGGFGTVWLAVDTQLDRTVAVKLAHAPDSETEQRMLREARALAAVRHPNCVRVFDIVQDPDGLAIVMEYIEGDPLSDVVLKSGLLADTLAARLWVNMADALAAAHERGVLHRDVKPSNVIVDTDGTAHLIDFGIARSKGDSTLTAAGMMVGTPDFLAPETARGDAASPASDAWQLAATVSYALTGHPPRGERDNPISSLMAAAQGEPNVKLPTRSVHHRLLVSALDAEPARRPSLAAIRSELSGWLSNAGLSKEGPVTRMISRPDPPTRPVR
jgi:serine/threonine protein kinase